MGQTSPRSVTELGRGHSQTDKQHHLHSDFWKQSLLYSAWAPSLSSQCHFEISYSANADVNVWSSKLACVFFSSLWLSDIKYLYLLKSKCWSSNYLFYFIVICIIIIFLSTAVFVISISENFLTVKGAALFLPQGNGSSPSSAPRITQRRNKHTGMKSFSWHIYCVILQLLDAAKYNGYMESVMDSVSVFSFALSNTIWQYVRPWRWRTFCH